MHKNNSSSSSTNIVGVHYRVGKKLGEGSFGVLYEGLKEFVDSIQFRFFLIVKYL